MQASQIPVKISTPFAANAGSAFASPIPPSTNVPGRASWQAGFPPANFLPISSGGIPPFGQDMNGILNAMSAWQQWQGAGGPVKYDSAFSSSIGGYPQGAFLTATTGLGWWVSTVDNNIGNPDSGAVNWIFLPLPQVWNGNPNGNVAGQAAQGTGSPSLCWDRQNGVLYYCSTSGTASTAKWTPLANLIPVNLATAAANYNYTRAMVGTLQVRTNSGAPMVDVLPTVGSVSPGWNVGIFNGDSSATLTISVPSGVSLNGIVNGSRDIGPGQATQITTDVNGNYWMTIAPLPSVFSGQAIYVNSNGTYAPGVYDLDSLAGPFTFNLESGGVDGDNYTFRDVGGVLAINPVSIASSLMIEGRPSPLVVDVNWITFTLTRKSGNWSLV